MVRISIYIKNKNLLPSLIESIRIYLINNKNITFIIKEDDEELFNTSQNEKSLENNFDYECSIFADENYAGEKISYLIELDNKGLPRTIFGLINNENDFTHAIGLLKQNKLFENYNAKLLDPFNELCNLKVNSLNELKSIYFNELFTNNKDLIFVKRNYILFFKGILESFKKIKQEKNIKDYFAKMFVSFQSTKSLSVLDNLFLAEYVFNNKSMKVFISNFEEGAELLTVCNFIKNYFLFFKTEQIIAK